MGIINVNIDKIYGRASQAEVDALKGEIEAANRMLYDGSGKGGDFLGWVSLPGRIGSEELEAVEACARSLASLADVIVVIGIGGSYLGTKAVYEAMNDSFQLLRKKQDRPLLLFAGQNLSEDYLSELLAAVKPYRIAAIVISKSGTTTEPAVAFRFFRRLLEERYGKEGAAARNEADDIVFVEVVGEGLRDPVETVGLDLQRLVIGDGLVFLLHAYPSFYRYFSTARGQLLVKYLHFRENFSCRGAKFLPIPIFRPV